MENKDDLQEIQDLFTLAKKESENRQKEKEINAKISKEIKENLRIPIYEFPSMQWFEEKGWKLQPYKFSDDEIKDVLTKNNLIIGAQVCNFTDTFGTRNLFIILNNFYKDNKDNMVFKGEVNTEEEWNILERILSR